MGRDFKGMRLPYNFKIENSETGESREFALSERHMIIIRRAIKAYKGAPDFLLGYLGDWHPRRRKRKASVTSPPTPAPSRLRTKRCGFTGGTCVRNCGNDGTVVTCWEREAYIDSQPDGPHGRHKDSMG
jgi:hypothetical protein